MVKMKSGYIGSLIILSLSFLQGCASNDQLFADYDSRSCQIASSYQTGLATTVTVTIRWEPIITFEPGSSKLSSTAIKSLKTNIAQLQRLPAHMLSLSSLSRDKTFDSFNSTLFRQRLDSIKQVLVNEHGISPARLVEFDPADNSSPHSPSDSVVDVALLDIDRRISLTLLDAKRVAVNLQSHRHVAGQSSPIAPTFLPALRSLSETDTKDTKDTKDSKDSKDSKDTSDSETDSE